MWFSKRGGSSLRLRMLGAGCGRGIQTEEKARIKMLAMRSRALTLSILLLAVTTVTSEPYIIGGSPGVNDWPWTFVHDYNLVPWSSQNLMRVNDIAVFRYTNTTDLYRFDNYQDWNNCNFENPKGALLTKQEDYCSLQNSDGCGTPVTVTYRPKFFASTVDGQCEQGWKIILQASQGYGIEVPPRMWFDCLLDANGQVTSAYPALDDGQLLCLQKAVYNREVVVGDPHRSPEGVQPWQTFPSQDYVAWASNDTHALKVGDTVVFRYDSPSQVLEVPDLATWLSCNTSAATVISQGDSSANAAGGAALAVVVQAKPRFFIGETAEACNQGKRVIIQAISGKDITFRKGLGCKGWWDCLGAYGRTASAWPSALTSNHDICLQAALSCAELPFLPDYDPTLGPAQYQLPSPPSLQSTPVSGSPAYSSKQASGTSTKHEEGLGGGAIAGIVLAFIVGVAFLASTVVYIVVRGRKNPYSGSRYARRGSTEEVEALHKVGSVWGWDAQPNGNKEMVV